MNNKNLSREIKLQQRKRELNTLRNEVSLKVDELIEDENVRRYIELKEKIGSLDKEIDSCNRQIRTINNEECDINGHPVLLFLGRDRDEYEGRTYYVGHCLNCGKKVVYPKGDMESYRMLDIKDGVVNTFEMIFNAEEQYRLFRDCYFKYPEVLKDKQNSKRIIYKAMKKRYEANK